MAGINREGILELQQSLDRKRRERERVEHNDRMIRPLRTSRLGQLDTQIAALTAQISSRRAI